MTPGQKLTLLTAPAKQAVTGGGKHQGGRSGNTSTSGICHSERVDGRWIPLSTILCSDIFICDGAYCINRRNTDMQCRCMPARYWKPLPEMT